NQGEQRTDHRQRNRKSEYRMVCDFFVTRKPPRQKKYSGQLRNLRWLKTNWAEPNPAPRAVDPHSEMRNVTRNERDRGNGDPKPPGPLPEMVIDQRGRDADNQTNSQPERLAFEEKISVAVAVAGKSAGAEKHHDADDEQSQHRNEEEVSAFP